MTTASTLQARHRSALPTLLVFILVLVGGIFYVKPLWDDLDSLNQGLNQKQTQKETFAKQLQDLQDLQQSLNMGSEVSKEMTVNAIPERLDEDKLLTDLNKIAQTNQVVLNSISFGVGGSSLNKIKRATVNVNLTGDDGAVINFLRGVEANQRKLVVKSVTVQVGKNESGLSRVNFNINMETYYQDRI